MVLGNPQKYYGAILLYNIECLMFLQLAILIISLGFSPVSALDITMRL